MKKFFVIFLVLLMLLASSVGIRAETIQQENDYGTLAPWGVLSVGTPWMFRFGPQSNTSKTWNTNVQETASVTYLSELGAYYSMKGVTYCDGSNGLGCLGAALVARDVTSAVYERLNAYAENVTSIAPAAGNTYLATHSLQWIYDGTNLVPQRQDLYAGAGTPAVREKGFSSTNITTNASTVVKASAGKLQRIVVGSPGTAETAAIYNDASSPCDTNLKGTITLTSYHDVELNIDMSTGICILTAGTTAGNLMIIYE